MEASGKKYTQNLATGRSKASGEGRGEKRRGSLVLAKMQTKMRPFPTAPLAGAAQGTEGWAQRLASPGGAQRRPGGQGQAVWSPPAPAAPVQATLLPGPRSLDLSWGREAGQGDDGAGEGAVGAKEEERGGGGRGQGTNMPLKGCPLRLLLISAKDGAAGQGWRWDGFGMDSGHGVRGRGREDKKPKEFLSKGRSLVGPLSAKAFLSVGAGEGGPAWMREDGQPWPLF